MLIRAVSTLGPYGTEGWWHILLGHLSADVIEDRVREIRTH